VTFAALGVNALTAAAALAAIMGGAWSVQRLTGQSGWIDAIWTFGVGATGAALALARIGSCETLGWRAGAIATAAGLWSLRLGLHLFARTKQAPDDPRYRKLIDEWGPSSPARLLLFLQAQGLVGAALALAVALAADAPSPGFRAQDVTGLAIFVLALCGEAAADAQLRRFKADPAHRGRICDVGLWGRSRHPNYFFEWLIWVAFAVVATGGDMGVGAWIAPALMYWTLRHASGIPPIEERMRITRGDAFRAYQARTPAFFPRLL
jgi:steroid 5-alpha reductase family enzyme